MGTLYIISTPIGNLSDITLRALETLKKVDRVLAEDTRVTKCLLSSYGIKKPIFRYDEKTSDLDCKNIAEKLKKGETMALVTDAGTPGISDPGWRLVSVVRKEDSGIRIEPIPGASSVTAMLSVSGIPAGRFTFLGYVPHKKGRVSFFKHINKVETRPVVFLESPHRIQKTFAFLNDSMKDKEIIVGRELTKIHEEIWKGTVSEASRHFIKERERGEFIIVIP